MPTLAEMLRQGSWDSDSSQTKKQLVNALRGAAETGATLGTGAFAGLAGMPYGVYKGITSGAYGTPEAPRIAAKEAQQFMERNTYQPRTEQGQEYVQKLGNLFNESKLPTVMPEVAALGAIPKQAYAAQAERAGMAAERALAPVVTRTMERGGKPAQLLTDLSQGSIRPMDVWHGSPHGPFGKFDPTKARTGEGNASYGEGAYLAQARGTGESYRRQLAKENLAMDLGSKLNMVDIGGTPLTKFNVDQSPELLDAAIAGKNKFVDLAKTKLNRWEDMAKDSSYPFPDYAKEKITAYKGLLDAADKNDVNYTGSGFLYKVDLPDEAIPKMIDWDKPLGQQSKEVQQAIEKTKSMLPPNAIEDLGGDLSLLYGKDVTPEQFLNTWESFGQKSGGETALAEQGVTGVRYLDQSSRGVTPKWVVNIPDFGGYDFPSLDEANAFIKNNPQSKTELIEPQVNTSNFVVFPKYQDLLTIKEINDKPLGAYK